MRIDPRIAALRGDRAAQRRSRQAMAETRQRWLALDGTSAILAEFRRFAGGEDVDRLPVLGELFRSVGKAQDFVADWSAGLVATLREHPLAQIPARHHHAGGYSMVQIAAERGAALAVSSYARIDAPAEARSAVFSDRVQHEIVLAGAGAGRIFRIAEDRTTSAAIDAEACDWQVGDRITIEGEAMCRQVESVHGRLVTLQLTRVPEQPEPTREFAYPGGELLMQSSGDKRASQHEMAIAVLGAMGRTDAAAAIGRHARKGHDHTRWEALRHTLALDPQLGFTLLSDIARSAGDPLSAAAAQLAAQLRQAYPQLGKRGEVACPV
ncbi:hypothetical protein G6N82_03505 [Altererythrobacter sp. BO-6]|uniref:hypothetical protein n=1 Tax=Altererythrobacter sp. BO-6 TaxID=2604537 RepID=UPI0013E16F25|nr:hypothetical protein [Altererythrobacter sp. BO-6]QIG53339.1 hypothetical protein G6N82_03505 [Altererythrobacter sp. BO-6]